MIMRLVVSATAAAALGLSAASAFAAQSNTPAQSAAMQQCAALEAQVTSLLPEAISQMSAKARSERDQGAKLCQQGKTDEGIATLEQARTDAMYRG
jgi:hypothetical protein